MSMNECDKINSYNALVSANHTESFIAPEKPKTVAHNMTEQIAKNKVEKEAEKVISTGYSSSPAINSKLNSSQKKQSTSSSSYSGGSTQSYYNSKGYGSGYSNGYGSGYSSGYGQTSQYKGNNLDYNSRISKIRQKAKETASRQKKYEESRGAGLIDFEGRYSFSIEKGKVKHNKGRAKNKVSKMFSKKMAKQAVVAAGVIVLEAALGMAMAEAKSSISGISNEIKKSLNNKVK